MWLRGIVMQSLHSQWQTRKRLAADTAYGSKPQPTTQRQDIALHTLVIDKSKRENAIRARVGLSAAKFAVLIRAVAARLGTDRRQVWRNAASRRHAASTPYFRLLWDRAYKGGA
jgi:hypothetical protein